MHTKKKTIYALGFFDGVHLGHQALLAACRELAGKHGCASGVVTFDAHPETLVAGNAPKLINSLADRQRLLYAYGMDTVLALPFDEQLMRTHWSAFLTQLVENGAAGFICGSDFRFGCKGEGNAQILAAFCESQKLPFTIVPQQLLDGIRVSSTHVRQLLADGDMESVSRFLGHPHVLTGEVISGRGLGRTIGVPTANLKIPEGVLLPKQGVYACLAQVNGKDYPAVTNIGSRPTVGGHHVTVEPWLLDFEGDLYGQPITLAFYAYLRPEKKFDSLDALRSEIQKNAAETRKIFEKS